MIVECVILFRVENLKQRRRGVTAMILAHFINFIEEEERVIILRFFHRLDNTARHGPNISPAMTANFALITYAAQ